jgi:hypothetical protein
MKQAFLIGGETIMVDVLLTRTCRCGRGVVFGMAERAPGAEPEPGGVGVGIHELLHCEEFRDMEVLDFMRWLRAGPPTAEA